MHCPKCGQQQISEEARFCSRCGFRLEVVSKLLAGDGVHPALMRENNAPPGELTVKQIGTRQGAKLVFWSIALLPVFFALGIFADTPGPLFINVTLFLAGILRILYVRLFGEDVPLARSMRKARAPQEVSAQARGALPASQQQQQGAPFANNFPPTRTNTAEMAQPPASVTEHTTRLLDDK